MNASAGMVNFRVCRLAFLPHPGPILTAPADRRSPDGLSSVLPADLPPNSATGRRWRVSPRPRYRLNRSSELDRAGHRSSRLGTSSQNSDSLGLIDGEIGGFYRSPS